MIGAAVAHDQRGVEGDQIRLAQQLVQLHIAQKAGFHQALVRISVPGNDPHSVALADIGHALADLAGADDAGHLIVQVQAHEARKGEVVLADLVVGLVQTPVGCHQNGHGMLRHGVGRIGRDTADGDAALSGSLQVHIVEPRAAQQDQMDAAFLQALHRCPGAFVIDEDTDCVEALGQVGRFRGKTDGKVSDVAVVGPLAPVLGQLGEEQPVIVLCAKERNPKQVHVFILFEALRQNLTDPFQGSLFITAHGADLQHGALLGVQTQDLQHVVSVGGFLAAANGDLRGQVYTGLGKEGRRTGVKPRRVGHLKADCVHCIPPVIFIQVYSIPHAVWNCEIYFEIV